MIRRCRSPKRQGEESQMMRSAMVREGLLPGAVAGVVGGLVFGITMARVGSSLGAAWLHFEPTAVDLAVGLSVAALAGAVFGLLVWHQRSGAGEIFLWGLAYGVFLWFLGPLTLIPLLVRGTLAWDVPSAQAAFPLLLGLLISGATAGLTLEALWSASGRRAGASLPAPLVRGAVSGYVAAWVVGEILAAQHQLPPFVSAHRPLVLQLFGALAGAGFALLDPR